MANVIVDKNKIDLLANAISAKSGEPLTLTLDEMVDAVDGIDTSGITPTGNINITQAGVTDVTNYATATVATAQPYVANNVEYITRNNTRYWRATAFAEVDEGQGDVAGFFENGRRITGDYYETLVLSAGTSVTPTESAQTVGGANVMMEGAVTVNAIPSTYVGSGIDRRDSTDLSASGATVSVPSGFYESSASKAVASGSATPASSISGTSATVSTGTNTLTLSKTVSNTPQVSAGYVSSGTAGNTNVSLTANVTTKASATIYPSASDQTISSGTYLTGTQTIKGVTYSNLTAGNIKKDVVVTIGDSADADRIVSVTGTYEGGGGGTSKNTQVVQGTTRTTSSTLTAIGAEMTVSKTGTYDIYWSAFRSSTSSSYTFGTQLYVGGAAYGTQNTSWSYHVQNNHLTNVSLTANQKIRVYGRNSRGSSYYIYAPTLVIVEA